MNIDIPGILQWYAVRVRPKGELRASGELSARGFEAFLPTSQVKRRWSDRVKTLEVPVFPGYLFCRFRPAERIKVLDTPAVIQILGIGGTPIPVSDAEIEAIQTLVTSRLLLTPWPYLSSGQRIRIEQGPLAGMEGIVAKAADGKPRVVVSVTLLQRSVAAEIERDWVGLIGEMPDGGRKLGSPSFSPAASRNAGSLPQFCA